MSLNELLNKAVITSNKCPNCKALLLELTEEEKKIGYCVNCDERLYETI